MEDFDIWEILSKAPRMFPEYVYKYFEKKKKITPCIVPKATEDKLPEVIIRRNSVSTIPAKWKKNENSKT